MLILSNHHWISNNHFLLFSQLLYNTRNQPIISLIHATYNIFQLEHLQ